MKMRNGLAGLLILLTFVFAQNLLAQTPNTSTMIVDVVDQNGAVVQNAKVSVTNTATGAVRDAVSGTDGRVTIPGLSLTGTYTVAVSGQGFNNEEVKNITLRSGETSALKVQLSVGSQKAEVTVYGTTEGVSTAPQIGTRIDSPQIDETPILGRKASALPLLNSAFRQAKGTGDLFVNQIYFTTGAGSRRTTTTTIDGANNDEAWGRQVMIANIPLGAIQEEAVLTTAFSPEYGWTAGPAINIVTKSGTNAFHGEALGMFRPGGMQAKTFSTDNFCPPSVPTCVVPTSLTAINPVDIPDKLNQWSGSIGGPIIKDRTFFFATTDYTRQDRTTFLSSSLPAFVRPADGHLDYTGHYRQFLFDGRIDHRINATETLMFRFNMDRFHDDNPQDAVSGTSAPSVARRYERRSWTTQGNLTSVLGANLLNEARLSYLNGDPVTFWGAPTISTTYTRGGNTPFTIGQSRSSNLYGLQFQFSDTLSWVHGRQNFRFGGSVVHHTSGGTGSEPGTASLGTFTFSNTSAPKPFDQLTLADVQSYTQPINFGISSYVLKQWLNSVFVQDSVHVKHNLTFDLGLRYDRQTLTDAKADFAPRIGFGWNPRGDARTAIRGGYGMYYTQIQSNLIASYLVGGLDGLASYTANNGTATTPPQFGFPTCLTAACVPVNVDPKAVASQIPPRDITIQAGRKSFYEAQFAKFGLNFDLLPNYPDKLVNPRSQIITIGAEREVARGWFISSDYVHQHWSDLARTVDLNAPTPFARTAPGQVRTVAAANLTRPIFPVNGGIRQVNVLTNLGVADYNGWQTQFSYRGNSRLYASVSYTLSKATNTTEPDGNGINPNDSNIASLGEVEHGPSVLDQRHRAVFTLSYRLPYNFTAGTLTQLASSRPFNATTGVDNNGDGANNDRPVINGVVVSKSAFRGTPTSDVAIFVENRIKVAEGKNILLRLEGFNLFNHANMLGRGATTYGDGTAPAAAFGQFVGGVTTANAIPAFANIDPPRMFQIQVRFTF